MGNVKNYVKYYGKWVVLVLMLSFLCVSLTAYCDVTDEQINNADGMLKTIYSQIDNLFSMNDIDEVKPLLNLKYTGSTFQVGKYDLSGFGAIINGIYKVFQGVGVTLMIAYFLYGLLEDIQFNQMYAEKLIRKFIFLFLAYAMVSRGMELIYAIADVGTNIVNAVSSGVSSVTFDTMSLKKTIYEACNTAEGKGGLEKLMANVHDITAQLGFIIELYLPSLVMKICGIIVNVICWSRFFELTIMGTIAPVTCADIALARPGSTQAARGIKNVIALSLSGAIILIVLLFGKIATTSIINGATTVDASNYGSIMWQVILINVVQVGLVVRANNISKQALGLA